MVGRHHRHTYRAYFLVRLGVADASKDTEYIKKHYTVDYDEERARPIINGRDDSQRVERGRKEFAPCDCVLATAKR